MNQQLRPIIDISDIQGIPSQYIFNAQEAIKYVNNNLRLMIDLFDDRHESFYLAHDEDGIPLTGPDMADCVHDFVVNTQHVVKVVGVRGSFWSHLRARWYARVVSTRPLVIELNTRYLNRSHSSLVNTISHELIHCIDHFYPLYAGHGSNSATGKDDTVPYWIGNAMGDEARDDGVRPEDHKSKKVRVCSGWWIFRRCYWVDRSGI